MASDNWNVVNRPEHYTSGKEECIDAMKRHMTAFAISLPLGISLGDVMMIGFCIGNAFKYGWRRGKKDGHTAAEDDAKAEWYEQMAFHVMRPEITADPRRGLYNDDSAV
jgi:hypothetical protein